MDQITRENQVNKHLYEDDILNIHSEIFVSYLQLILLRVVIRRISLNIKINFAILFDIYTISTYFVQFPPYFTIRNLFTTIEPERAQNTIRITSQSPISLYSTYKVVRC